MRQNPAFLPLMNRMLINANKRTFTCGKLLKFLFYFFPLFADHSLHTYTNLAIWLTAETHGDYVRRAFLCFRLITLL